NNWYTSTVTARFSATDNVSCVDWIEFNLDGASWQGYDGSVVIASEGIHNLQFRAIDIAGNVEAAQSQQIKIDKTPPELTVGLDKYQFVRREYLTLQYTATVAA